MLTVLIELWCKLLFNYGHDGQNLVSFFVVWVNIGWINVFEEYFIEEMLEDAIFIYIIKIESQFLWSNSALNRPFRDSITNQKIIGFDSPPSSSALVDLTNRAKPFLQQNYTLILPQTHPLTPPPAGHNRRGLLRLQKRVVQSSATVTTHRRGPSPPLIWLIFVQPPRINGFTSR